MNYLPETGWLIERRDTDQPRWWTGLSGNACWTTDSLKAVRFARAVDGERMVAVLKMDWWWDVTVTEHMWCNNELA